MEFETRDNGDGLTVLIAGDWAPIRAFEPIVREVPEAVYGDVLPRLRKADLRIINCECALASAGKPAWKSGAVFKGEPVHVRGLAAVPFEIACLANNHVFDYGLAAFVESLRVLRTAGVRTVGAGLSEEEAWAPLRVEMKGSRISVVNFGEGEDLTAARKGHGTAGWELDRARRLVRELKERGDCVIAVVHAGLEYIPYPPPYIWRAFRSLVDAGADAVVGHHPHVPQGIEICEGRPIAYSLGNFVFDQPTGLRWRKTGFCLLLTIVDNEVVSHEPVPYAITPAGLSLLAGKEKSAFLKTLDRISKPLGSEDGVRGAWDAYLDHYGLEGLKAEIGGIMAHMQEEPRKGAAMLRNRLTTPQHAELWRDALTRVIEGGGPADKDASAAVKEWFTLGVED